MLPSSRKNYFQKGFIDIVGIIIIVFLAATVFVGAKVTSEKNFILNINNKAATLDQSKLDKQAKDREKAEKEEQKEKAKKEEQAQKQAARAPENNDGPKGSYDKLSDAQRASIDFDTYKNNVNNGIPVPTPITQTASAPAGSCDSNGAAYSEGSVVVFGGNDYRKCIGGRWTTGSYSITELTTVPVYLQDQYNQAKTNEQNNPPPPPPPPTTNTSTTNFSQAKTTCEANGGFWNTTLNICGQGQGNCESFGGSWDGTKCTITKCVAKVENLGCQSGCRLERTTNVDCTVTTSCVAAVGCSPATNTTTAQAPAYSCPANYTVATNEYGVKYCKENPQSSSSSKKADGSICSNDSECNSGTCGSVFLGLKACRQPSAIPSVQQAAQLANLQANTKPLGETCSKGSECGTGSCSSSWTASDGSTTFSIKGNVCTYTSAEQNAFLNAQSARDTEVVSTVAQSALTLSGAAKLGGIASDIYALNTAAGSGLSSLPTAAYVYGQTALSTGIAGLPTAAQTAIRLGLPALEIGGTGYCIINPRDPSCELMAAGYYSNPLAFEQSLRESGSTLANFAKSAVNKPIVAYEFQGLNAQENYQAYINEYGQPPSTIQILKHPNELYDFQTQAIGLAQNPNTTNQDIVALMRQIENENPNIKFKVGSSQNLADLFGEGTAGTCVLEQCPAGFLGLQTERKATVYLTTPSEYAKMYDVSNEGAQQIMLQKIGHETGHGQDFIQLGLSDPWSTEFRQKAFNVNFYNAVGSTPNANYYQDWLNLVQQQSNVVFQP